MSEQPMPLKESGIVTALSVIGLIFGIIALFGSFIPCIGIFAVYISVPAALVSALAIVVAIMMKAKRSLAIAAFTISAVSFAISLWQAKTVANTMNSINDTISDPGVPEPQVGWCASTADCCKRRVAASAKVHQTDTAFAVCESYRSKQDEECKISFVMERNQASKLGVDCH